MRVVGAAEWVLGWFNSHVLKCFGKEKLSKFNFLTQVNLFVEVTIEESFGLYTMFYAQFPYNLNFIVLNKIF